MQTLSSPNIKVNDTLQIAGVLYQVIHIESCNNCCLNNSRVCALLDSAIMCGNKTHLGFKTTGFNPKSNKNQKSKTK